MNYDEMSDYEINKAVGIAKGFPPNVIGHIDHGLKFGAIAEYVTDYCNNPADYMPIAIENNIDIWFEGGMVECDTGYPGDPEGLISVELKKSQIGRAICIVYLEMMDAKQ